MDYRSPFELRQQLIEEARAAQATSPTKKSKSKTKNAPSTRVESCAAPPPREDASLENLAGFMPSTALPDDPTALVREVPGADNIEALNAALEREEAVQRYVEKEKLSVEDSAKYIMANGSTGQRISFFGHVREKLLELPPKRISKVLEILLDSMWAQDPELQCHAPDALLNFVGLLDGNTASEVYDATKTMLSVQMQEVRVSWSRLMLGLVDYLPLSVLQGDLIALAVSKSDHAQPQDQRELSCQLLGRVCPQLSVSKAEELVLPRALALCQDTNVSVRQNMCQQLCTIAHALGVEKAKALVAPDLFELLSDEEQAVSRAAFSCLIDLVEFFGPAYRREKLFPIIKTFISNPPSEVVGLLVGEFGRFLDAIKTDITDDDDVALFVEFFCNAATRSGEEARRHCAFNFPAVVASLPRSVFATDLSKALAFLSTDPCVGARRSVAAGLHALLPLLPASAVDSLEKPFLHLIRDHDSTVRTALMTHIHALLDYFRKGIIGAARSSFFAKVLDAVLSWVAVPLVNWHTMHHVVDIVDRYIDVFEERALMEQVLPLLWSYVKTGATVLKVPCATLLMHIIAGVETPSVQAHVFSKLNADFARASSCYARQAYLLFVKAAFAFFSLRCIRERMLECCLELQRDTVATVRMALARCLPLLSRALRTATPAGALEDEFAMMVERLCEDAEEEVRETAQSYLRTANGKRRGDHSPLHSCKLNEAEEEEDRRREASELPMLEHAKETDKAERRAKLRDLLKSEREKDYGELPSPGKVRKAVTGPAIASPVANRKGGTRTPVTASTVTLPRLNVARYAAASAPKVSVNRKRT
ncbi:hypothetical protein ABB37_05554 [Leptomonas pyrrhocoris]|uniref:Serine/threonine-protein phosphatase 4 regulatory subunit 4 n=1 Tax=Leptomonas pyrrhocoris TaxID=157538 RepID=A0A0N0DUK0_LEPPY|nr:hypothetical protein ABB37_05554 [Leptomonas pyrrhocoris]KPA79014.1 hypothetical protein ABB37_05554 [Leptomonas pyrrhocoris]|eukprot:XP_015657453.1 hypothetical protein ABB37_05554 [Leptomonas pyrrhocoris]